MTTADPDMDATLAVAEQVLEVLESHQVEAVVIGAMALAVHHFPRETEDLDLAVATAPETLARVGEALRARGWEVVFRTPDAEDPLGGVLDVRAPGADLVQVVNFLNPPAGGFPRLVQEGVARAEPLVPGSKLGVVDLETLIAFKLYAGGAKSKLDVLELLERNPQLDMAALQQRCEALRLAPELAQVLALRAS